MLKNFAAPLSFFAVFQVLGAKPAIAVALIITAVAATWHLVKKERMSPFFKVSSALTLVLGGLDLWVATPRFFRFEPAAVNAILGLAFAASLFTPISLIEWFAGGLPEQLRPDLRFLPKNYLKQVTAIWSFYAFAKAGLFYWFATRVNLGNLIIIRSVVGGVSGVLLVGGEILYRKWKFGLTPAIHIQGKAN